MVDGVYRYSRLYKEFYHGFHRTCPSKKLKLNDFIIVIFRILIIRNFN